MDTYILMKKNEKIAKINMQYGLILNISEIYREDLIPIGVFYKNGKKITDIEECTSNLNFWWKNHSIPIERNSVRKALECLNVKDINELKIMGKGLSLLNQYWIQKEHENLKWEDINYWDHLFSKEMGEALFFHKPSQSPFHIIGLSPDNGINGMLKKRWIIKDNEYYLQKSGTGLIKEEVFNEVLASNIMNKANISNANYQLYITDDKEITCISKCMTNKDTELISFLQILDFVPRKDGYPFETELEHLYTLLETLHVPNYKEKLNEMLYIDYILAGTDRHYNNISLIYDTKKNTYEMSPIYDSGDCLWNNKTTNSIHILDDTITAKPICNKSTYGTWEQQKQYISNYISLRPNDLILAVADYIKQITKYSEISSERVNKIANGILERNYQLQQYLISKNVFIPNEYLFPEEYRFYFDQQKIKNELKKIKKEYINEEQQKQQLLQYIKKLNPEFSDILYSIICKQLFSSDYISEKDHIYED